jgi:hypothetical protein
MATRVTKQANPPDEAGNLGSFERDQGLAPHAPVPPGSTWESPREHEQPVKQDATLWVFALIALSLVIALMAHCAMLDR